MAGGGSQERSLGAFVVAAFSVLCVMMASTSSAEEVAPLFNLPHHFPPPLPRPSLVLNFFMHDRILTPVNESAFVRVLPVPGLADSNQSFFGAIVVFDNRLTKDPQYGSDEVGRGRGLYVFDNNSGDKLPALEFTWTAEFNSASGLGGSTLVYKGYDRILDPVRSVAIVGGTGKLALAKGYTEISTFSREGFTNIINITSYIFFEHSFLPAYP